MKMIMTINIDDDGEVEGKLGAEMMMESVLSVRSCLLISLIKCVNGHKGLLFQRVLKMFLFLSLSFCWRVYVPSQVSWNAP